MIYADMLADLRWHADMVITNDDGDRVWLKATERNTVTDCCFEHDPCPTHAALAAEPNGCRHCGVAPRMHLSRWHETAGRHQWTAPDERQIRCRMYARRAMRLTTDRDY